MDQRTNLYERMEDDNQPLNNFSEFDLENVLTLRHIVVAHALPSTPEAQSLKDDLGKLHVPPVS